nr:formylglycine-generating enzyme family protein [Candidatus Microthrix sp.]
MQSDGQPCCAPVRPTEPGALPADAEPSGAGAGSEHQVGTQRERIEFDFVDIPGGEFTMGTNDPRGYPTDGEGPEHTVALSPFAIARTTVTNDQFEAFTTATGHQSTAERFGNSFVFGGLLPDDFPPTRGVEAAPWWREVDGADWRHPEGPHSDVADRGGHPVVHVSWEDAVAFCDWSGTTLPTEAQWECAARGGRSGSHFPWGDDLEPNGEHRMNVFQGDFPGGNTGADGWIGTSPADHFPPNGFGLHQMTGNVWEWCLDWFALLTYNRRAAVDPAGPPAGSARVMRGGSYLCHESYCWRYRVDARSANQTDSTAGNIGFRVVAGPS